MKYDLISNICNFCKERFYVEVSHGKENFETSCTYCKHEQIIW